MEMYSVDHQPAIIALKQIASEITKAANYSTATTTSNIVHSFMIGVALILSSCSHHAPYKATAKQVSGKVAIHGVSKQQGKLYSYSSIPGELDSKIKDYNPIKQIDNIVFFAHKAEIKTVEKFLNSKCCYDTETVANKFIYLQDWIAETFETGTSIQLDIILVPYSHNYYYVSKYNITEQGSRARFAFHYDPNNVEESLEDNLSSLGHELTHIYFELGKVKPKNLVSEEAIAQVIGVCSTSLVNQTLPEHPFSSLPNEDILNRFRNSPYKKSILELAQNNSPYIVGTMAAQLFYENITSSKETTPSEKLEALYRACDYIIKNNSDLMENLPVTSLVD